MFFVSLSCNTHWIRAFPTRFLSRNLQHCSELSDYLPFPHPCYRRVFLTLSIVPFFTLHWYLERICTLLSRELSHSIADTLLVHPVKVLLVTLGSSLSELHFASLWCSYAFRDDSLSFLFDFFYFWSLCGFHLPWHQGSNFQPIYCERRMTAGLLTHSPLCTFPSTSLTWTLRSLISQKHISLTLFFT